MGKRKESVGSFDKLVKPIRNSVGFFVFYFVLFSLGWADRLSWSSFCCCRCCCCSSCSCWTWIFFSGLLQRKNGNVAKQSCSGLAEKLIICLCIKDVGNVAKINRRLFVFLMMDALVIFQFIWSWWYSVLVFYKHFKISNSGSFAFICFHQFGVICI